MDYRHFECASRVDGTRYRCYFVFLQTAISLRHSDTVDVRFLVNGKRITVALPHVAFARHAQQKGRPITDEQAASIAAWYLTEALESGGGVEDLTVAPERVLELAEQAGGAGRAPEL